MQKKFLYQPAAIEAVIFWGLIMAALALAITLLEESTSLAWLSIIVALGAIIVAIFQIRRYRLVSDGTTVTLGRLWAGNALSMQLATTAITTVGHHTLVFHNTPYGDFQITVWRDATEVLKWLK